MSRFTTMSLLGGSLVGLFLVISACESGGAAIIETPIGNAASAGSETDSSSPQPSASTPASGTNLTDPDASFEPPNHPNHPTADSGACDGVGRYQGGKARPAYPCCPGLNRLSFLTAVTVSENGGPPQKACEKMPVNEYACIVGTCGDGICEDAESRACGCIADCPSAVWDERDGG